MMQFSRIVGPSEDLEIWSASSLGFSFVISNENRSGPGLRGRPGFVATWRPLYLNRPAIKVGGSPFNTFAEAETACRAMLMHLTSICPDKPANLVRICEAERHKEAKED
jgi:hypothetical protein